jgi:hypothetical protein
VPKALLHDHLDGGPDEVVGGARLGRRAARSLMRSCGSCRMGWPRWPAGCWLVRPSRSPRPPPRSRPGARWRSSWPMSRRPWKRARTRWTWSSTEPTLLTGRYARERPPEGGPETGELAALDNVARAYLAGHAGQGRLHQDLDRQALFRIGALQTPQRPAAGPQTAHRAKTTPHASHTPGRTAERYALDRSRCGRRWQKRRIGAEHLASSLPRRSPIVSVTAASWPPRAETPNDRPQPR